jgi:hypothetical protein
MAAKLITLEQWAADTYGDSAPAMPTIRRWARESRIYPAPIKTGRSYFVRPDAEYIDPTKPKPPSSPSPCRRGGLVGRIQADQ